MSAEGATLDPSIELAQAIVRANEERTATVDQAMENFKRARSREDLTEAAATVINTAALAADIYEAQIVTAGMRFMQADLEAAGHFTPENITGARTDATEGVRGDTT